MHEQLLYLGVRQFESLVAHPQQMQLPVHPYNPP